MALEEASEPTMYADRGQGGLASRTYPEVAFLLV